LDAKVSDFGLSRQIQSDQQGVTITFVGPLKWMAPECLRCEYVPKSDCWSFAIVLWEIIHKGERPYGKIDPVIVSHEVLNGNVFNFLEMPNKEKSPILYEIMSSCLKFNADERISFKEINRTMIPKLKQTELKVNEIF